MTKKDQALLKKMIGSAETTPVDRIASAFVDTGLNEMKSQPSQMFHRVDDREAELYSSLFKKGISGKLGTLAIELPTSDTNPLADILNSDFSDDSLQTAYHIVYDNYIANDNYSIFACIANLDLNTVKSKSRKKKDDDDMEDMGFDASYDFVLLMVLPCTPDSPGIVYDRSGNVFKDKTTQNDLKAPMCAFLYPSLSDMEPDYSKAMCFAKSNAAITDMTDIAKGFFDADVFSTPEEQAEGFQALIDSAFPNNMPYDPMQKLFGYFDDLNADAESNDTALTSKELANALVQCGDLQGEDADAVLKTADEYDKVNFSLDNLAPKNITIGSDCATIKTDLSDISEIKRQIIDGEEYLLIPARNVTVQSIKVK